jgi:hypothetical protein
LRHGFVSLTGSEGNEFIKQYNFQQGFFGAKAFTLEERLTGVISAGDKGRKADW